MTSSVRSFAPASVSNVACGFDTLGFAIAPVEPGGEARPLGDVVEAKLRDEPGVAVVDITGDGGALPTEPDRNTAAVAAAALLERCRVARGGDPPPGLELRVHKGMPLKTGLGSSAASAAAGAHAAATLLQRRLGLDLSRSEVLAAALEGERVASGALHGDNVAPSLYGGFVLVRALEPDPDVVELPATPWLWCALARPHLEIDTAVSRRGLAAEIPIATAVRQWADLGALVAALYRGDSELLARALRDHYAEPVRRAQVPGFGEAMASAREAGALGGSLSGSGPTLFALCTSERTAATAATAMAEALATAAGVACDRWISVVGGQGARSLAETASDAAGP